jgi:hypothetical protein
MSTDVMDRAAAEAIDREFRSRARAVADSIERFREFIPKAKTAYYPLGYRSWPAYVVDVVSTEMGKLHADDRRKLVPVLASEGMSCAAIGKALSVNDTTVRADLQLQESTGGSISLPAMVTGMDGNDYPAWKPKPKPPSPSTPPPVSQSKPSAPPKPTAPEPTPEERRVARLRERTRGACKDVREFMADLSNAPYDQRAGWICTELNEAVDEMSDMVTEFFDWYSAVTRRWAAAGNPVPDRPKLQVVR